MGRVSNDILPTVYGASDVTLLPMKRDTLFIFGMVIPESLACGVPVVSAPVPAAVDHIHEGVSGKVVDFEDPELLANAIEVLLDSDENYASISRRCREYCLESLDWEILAERYVSAYESAIRN